MNLTYLQYQMSHHGLNEMRIRRRRNYRITSWELYDSGEIVDKDVLYVVGAEDLEKVGRGNAACSFLIVDYPSDSELPELDGIYLNGKCGLPRLLNILNRIFQDYRQWEFALLYSDGIALDALLELSGAVLHMPLTIVNNEFHFIAKNSLYASLFDSDTVDKDELDSIIWTQEFQDCTHRKGVFHFYLKSEKKDLLCFNIVFSNRFYARVLGSVEDEAYGKVQEELFKRLADCVENIFSIQKVAPYPFMKSREFCSVVSEMLDGRRPVDDSVLRRNGWCFADEYQITVFCCSRHFPIEEGDRYLYRQLTNIFTEGCILERNQDFVCVRNLTSAADRDDDFRERLAVFLREHVVKAGLSNIFRGTEDFGTHLVQAYDALKIGERKAPHFWYYNFEDYAFQYLLDQCVSSYSAEEVIAPELRKIMQMDKEKGTDLYSTLKIYLRSGCNASKTAEQLYIHRSSLMKRLNKIESATCINLENSDTRLYLELSYKLLDRKTTPFP